MLVSFSSLLAAVRAIRRIVRACPSSPSHMHIGHKAPLAQEELVEKLVVARPARHSRGPQLPPGDDRAVGGVAWCLFCARAAAHPSLDFDPPTPVASWGDREGSSASH